MTYTLSLSRPATCHRTPTVIHFTLKNYTAKWCATKIENYAARFGIATSAVDWNCKAA